MTHSPSSSLKAVLPLTGPAALAAAAPGAAGSIAAAASCRLGSAGWLGLPALLPLPVLTGAPLEGLACCSWRCGGVGGTHAVATGASSCKDVAAGLAEASKWPGGAAAPLRCCDRRRCLPGGAAAGASANRNMGARSLWLAPAPAWVPGRRAGRLSRAALKSAAPPASGCARCLPAACCCGGGAACAGSAGSCAARAAGCRR